MLSQFGRAIFILSLIFLPFSNQLKIPYRGPLTDLPNKTYLPLILNNYKFPPPTTISHYISFGQNDWTYQNFYNMGKALGQNVESNFWGYVILQFGEPWKEGDILKILTYGGVPIPINDLDYYIKGYLTGFYQNSPSDAFVVTVIGLTNEGYYFSNDPQGFGHAWGTLIDNLSGWIETPPSYAGKVSVAGGIDNELSWNTANSSLDWKYAYIANASKFYIYYGDCNSCPYYEQPDWTPVPLGWTLEQVYEMSNDFSGFAIPQIYRKDGQNSGQWYYLSLYMDIIGYEPIGFMGTLTTFSACNEGNPCYSNTPYAIDNTPEEGYEQLWGLISSDPRTAKNDQGIPFDLPVSTDISWDHWKVRVNP